MPSKRPLLLVGGLILWSLAVLALFGFAEITDSAPGDIAKASQWPAATQFKLSDSRSTLIMFVHPQCPCSRASLEELDRLVSVSPNSAQVTISFIDPINSTKDWLHTDLWDHALRIPGATVFADKDCAESKKFSAFTSGTVVLYSPAGQEIFRGGITDSRGHEGDNPGKDAIQTYFTTGHIPIHSTPVFGCALFSRSF
jgi:hypothetical protein